MIARLFWFCVGSIAYVYAGYPALLALLARTRPRPKPYPAATPSVTLLIAAYNEQAVIGEKLENTLALDYPADRLQIIVAADGSDDGTPDLVRAFAGRGVELSYSPPRRGKMAAINRAMAQGRGEIVVFSDANNLYASDALRELTAPFADPTVGAVSGAKQILKGDGALGESEGMYWKYESFIKEQETRLGCCTGVAGEIFALRRDLWELAPDGIINDDFYLAMRLVRRGYNVVYAPNARSAERVAPTVQDEVARRARIIAGRYQAIALAPQLLPFRRPLIIWEVVSHKFMRPLVPLAMVGALLTNLVAVARPSRRDGLWGLGAPTHWVMLGLQASFYTLAWLGNRVERDGKWGKLLYLPTFLVNSNGAAVIGLYRFLRGRQTTLWERVQRRQSALE